MEEARRVVQEPTTFRKYCTTMPVNSFLQIHLERSFTNSRESDEPTLSHSQLLTVLNTMFICSILYTQ